MLLDFSPTPLALPSYNSCATILKNFNNNNNNNMLPFYYTVKHFFYVPSVLVVRRRPASQTKAFAIDTRPLTTDKIHSYWPQTKWDLYPKVESPEKYIHAYGNNSVRSSNGRPEVAKARPQMSWNWKMTAWTLMLMANPPTIKWATFAVERGNKPGICTVRLVGSCRVEQYK
jgi:hypothetical protein